MTIRHSVKVTVNSFLNRTGLELRSLNSPFTDYRDYIPFQDTLEGATTAGLTVGDYIDRRFNVPGSTQDTIDRMAALGVFADPIEAVCEIGPGSGRYLAKTRDVCRPSRYEVYETAADWADWLATQYDVVVQPCDGVTLAATATASVDLVQAHKVMPGQPSLVICRYYEEMVRVVRPGGKIVFDIVTENCMTDDVLAQWLATGGGYQHYPCLIPRQFTIDFFAARGVAFRGSFLVPMLPGKTECMVFAKDA